MNSLEVVITSYRRPENLLPILESVRSQSLQPDKVTVIHAPAAGVMQPSQKELRLTDSYYDLDKNYGPFNRFVPLGSLRCDFTLFLDDDFIHGTESFMRMVDTASNIGNFGVVGHIGRVCSRTGEYFPTSVKAAQLAKQVDSVVRAYLVRTQHLHLVLKGFWQLPLHYRDNLMHDDLLLAVMMSINGLTNWVYPARTPAEELVLSDLPEPHAIWRRPSHFTERSDFLRMAQDVFGWKPLLSTQMSQ